MLFRLLHVSAEMKRRSDTGGRNRIDCEIRHKKNALEQVVVWLFLVCLLFLFSLIKWRLHTANVGRSSEIQ